MAYDEDDDRLALAHAVLGAVRKAGGQLAADRERLLLYLPADSKDPMLLPAVEAGQQPLLAILHTRQALARARLFAAGCRPRRAPFPFTVAPPCLRRG